MREPAFVSRNKAKWQRFEEMLRGANRANATPDEKADLFIHLTDDLSYAKTFYPRSKTTQYLNQLTSSIYSLIYKNKQEDRGRIMRFWTQELPLLYYEQRRYLLYAFLIFVSAVVLGVVSSHYDNNFARLILSDGYVNMTLENIEKGDPMGVYKTGNEWYVSVVITIHNIRVSFFCFVMGIFSSLGTAFMLLYNGTMVGVFQYFFYQRGLFWTSFLTIWIHGTLEISAIIIAGAAGMVMGNSALFPQTYSRIDSFIRGAKKGVKMLLGLVPVFIVAGFLEGYVTRHTEMPTWLKIAIIGGSACVVLFYFVLYPFVLGRQEAQKTVGQQSV